MIQIKIGESEYWDELSKLAWQARNKAKLVNPNSTKVGASIMTNNKNYFSGCNAQHKFRSHDIHAEICAIGNMYSETDDKILYILIVSKREFLTPCGSCLDWIIQFSNSDTKVGIQSIKNGIIKFFEIKELIPYYPK